MKLGKPSNRIPSTGEAGRALFAPQLAEGFWTMADGFGGETPSSSGDWRQLQQPVGVIHATVGTRLDHSSSPALCQ